MKYYYGNSYKEAMSNPAVDITDTEILAQYEQNYSWVIPAEDQGYDICLDSDSYELDEKNGTLIIYKQIFDSFEKDALIRIKFVDEDNEPTYEYIMRSEDAENIYCEFFD